MCVGAPLFRPRRAGRGGGRCGRFGRGRHVRLPFAGGPAPSRRARGPRRVPSGLRPGSAARRCRAADERVAIDAASDHHRRQMRIPRPDLLRRAGRGEAGEVDVERPRAERDHRRADRGEAASGGRPGLAEGGGGPGGRAGRRRPAEKNDRGADARGGGSRRCEGGGAGCAGQKSAQQECRQVWSHNGASPQHCADANTTGPREMLAAAWVETRGSGLTKSTRASPHE